MKNRKLMSIGALLIVALIVGVVGTVLAQDTPSPVVPRPFQPGWGHNMMPDGDDGETFVPPMFNMRGKGRMGGHMMGGFSLPDIAAEVLGISLDEVWQALESGISIADLADSYDVDSQEIVDAALDAHQEAMDTAVAAGWLTAENAAEMQEQMAEMISSQIDQTWEWGTPGGMMPGSLHGPWQGRGSHGSCVPSDTVSGDSGA